MQNIIIKNNMVFFTMSRRLILEIKLHFLKGSAKKILQNFARMDEPHHLFMHDIRQDTFSTLTRGVDGDWFVYYTINGSYVISCGIIISRTLYAYVLFCNVPTRIIPHLYLKRKRRFEQTFPLWLMTRNKYSNNWLNLIVILLIILWYLNVQESFTKAF